MDSPFPRLAAAARRFLCFALPIGGALLFAGCASSVGPPPPRRFHEMERQPRLAGAGSFLAGELQASVVVEPFLKQPAPKENADAEKTERPKRHGGGSGFSGSAGGMQFGGGERGGMGGRGEGGMDGPPGGGPGGEAHFDRGPEVPRGPAMNFPRQTLRLTFTNSGKAPVKLEVTELRSLVGNFAPQPDRLELAPGASTALNPVSGDAGGVLETLEVTVSVRRGNDRETQIIKLVRAPEPTAPATSAAP